ncbi:MAG: triose-phosphate isomerase [Candidatus Omnitrophica bacterium]|nr:triose-phosphate isomerase [Candidatus Omnitrophota bacterium]
MKRLPIIAGNWKMNTLRPEASRLALAVAREAREITSQVEVVLCPPFTGLDSVSESLKGSQVLLGAQDSHWKAEGACTGEVSVPMLKEIGVSWVIVGHSERRRGLGESEAMIHQKLMGVLQGGLRAILCVGETLEERKRAQTWQVIERQLATAFEGVEPLAAAKQVVAYEPVWAIGTGQNATPAQAQEVHAQIRQWLSKRFSPSCATALRLQYGGSAKPDNAEELLRLPDVDGLLVGGASLQAESFLSMLQSAVKAKGGCACSTEPS